MRRTLPARRVPLATLAACALVAAAAFAAAGPAAGGGPSPTARSAADAAAPDGRLVVVWRSDRHAALSASGGISSVSDAATRGAKRSVVKARPGQAASVAAQLRANPDVAAVVPDAVVSTASWPATAPNDPYFAGNQADLALIGAPTAWQTTTGSPSVVVAVIDTGATLSHPDMAGVHVAATWNVITGSPAAADDNGHGTHTLGTIAAQTNNGVGVAGIAPGVSVMPIKALDANGSGWWSDFDTAVDWAVAHGARIISMSLGGPLSPDQVAVFRTSFDDAYAHGVTIVAAAGNNDNSGLFYPADFDHVISVSATDNADHKASYSNFNDLVDIAAPGNAIVSTYPTGCPAAPACYAALYGTSMATPHVAAVAALRLSAHPGETPDQVADALERSAVDLGTAGRDPVFGWGRLDAAAAVSYQPPVTPPAPSSTPPAPTASPAPIPTPTATPTPEPAPAVVFVSPRSGTAAVTSGTIWSVGWTESGSIASGTLAEDVGRVVSPGSCANVSFQTAWTSQVSPPATVHGLSAGYCYRWRLAVTSPQGLQATAISGTVIVSVPASVRFSVPRSGVTVATRSTRNTLSWTRSGTVLAETIVEQYGRARSSRSCSGVAWRTAWSRSVSGTSFALSGFSRGYCYRYTLTATTASGARATVGSGSLLVR